jgi:hypothetical protein
VLAVPEKPPEIVKKSSIGEDLKESGTQPLPEEDLEFIRKLEENLTKERQKAEGRGQRAQAFWRPKGRSASAQSSRSKGIKPPLNESSVACIRGGV